MFENMTEQEARKKILDEVAEFVKVAGLAFVEFVEVPFKAVELVAKAGNFFGEFGDGLGKGFLRLGK